MMAGCRRVVSEVMLVFFDVDDVQLQFEVGGGVVRAEVLATPISLPEAETPTSPSICRRLEW